MKRALICGISGQDGAYLAQLLLDKGYTVAGTSRDAQHSSFENLENLGLRDRVECISMAPTDFRSVLQAFEAARPDEVYALAGQSSVGLSFEMPVETLESLVFGTLNLLEVMRMAGRNVRLFHASSSECFGTLDGEPATELTAFRPRSPYGVAKTSSHMLVSSYRAAYGLFAANGILFNHESPLRKERFVTRKITSAVARIALGSEEMLELGDISVVRDWGWAPEYVEAMWRILQADEPDDFIVATGVSHRLEEFIAAAFAVAGLDWKDHVKIDQGHVRPADLCWSGAVPAKIEQILGWKASVGMEEVAKRMVETELAQLRAVGRELEL